MAEIHDEEKKIVIKIVYYGPALSGKTTNLIQLHELIRPGQCGDLMSLETRGDRTLFFDMLPILTRTNGEYRVKIKLFTVPGQVAHDATRKAVLSRADGVVFVADSQVAQSVNNFQSFENLEKNAGRIGLDFERLPLVIQFNKRDLPEILATEEVLSRWGPAGLPVTFSTALTGEGVRTTFETILSATYRKLDDAHGLEGRYRIMEENLLSILPPCPESMSH
ncbi:GTP-binding protein [Desulfoluna spongiiphila]|uniref:GTP-binding protein n=1 Tax=Desulfoluna spongiiphila TaxID=419481 RepID=UPI001254B059|nr:GTPase [Desulfoluna spongiiphila]VVS93234.1 p-loop containing nucleoside triphosphate hydrolase [Desulfoluna spongiiphila]